MDLPAAVRTDFPRTPGPKFERITGRGQGKRG